MPAAPPMGSCAPISFLLLALASSLFISSSRVIELKTKEARLQTVIHDKNETSSIGFDPSKVIHLSWHPRAFIYEGFLSDGECEHLISLAQGKLEQPLAGNNNAGNTTLSSTIRLARGQDEIVSKIEERISTWTLLPIANGEEIQVSQYMTNETDATYYDNNHEEPNELNGGNTVATVLMYLSTVTHGGETVFPKAELKGTQPKDETWSDCAASGYAMKPVKGDALLLFNLHPNATADESSLHGSCAVLEGEKWSATKWIHARALNAEEHSTEKKSSISSILDEECTDEDDNCRVWAASGECKRNPVFMLGTPDYYGSCRKSCGAC